MTEEFTYSEIVRYIKGTADQELRSRIELAIATDENLKLEIANLKASLRLVSECVKHTRKKQFESYIKENSFTAYKNRFVLFRYAAAILLLITASIYLIHKNTNFDNSSIVESELKLDTLNQESREVALLFDSVNSINDTLFGKMAEFDSIAVRSTAGSKESNDKNHNFQEESATDDLENYIAYNDFNSDTYLDQYEFDHISVMTRGSNVDDWKFRARTGDSLYQIRAYKEALLLYEKLNDHPEIWERLAFSYSRLNHTHNALKYYAKYKNIQPNKDESDWGEWLLLLRGLPKSKKGFDLKTHEILSKKEHKYYFQVNQFTNKYFKRR
ncbi:MAG: hypothetical protein IT266_11430 [Saprospiraceae bacterium]|nr:hypothetical protein [Saprospiraceae bacterium]